ncbi:E3 ubiquitin-protein ligase LRSAM1-like [Condylostylus longicornis]|uniref:E3 ubiquitin-protein ligase LRSAM1-like n=1 Tax=Condylostylus longicornis TaxID=2530218 RepID=UPI00244DCBCA|nr:E3 ubiquitin-protein ligase LRSAM1-like [Condylostylus longicornis]
MGCKLSKDEPPPESLPRKIITEVDMEKIDYKSRLEYKICLAKDTPEPVFDLSECNLKEVPSGVFINCRILRKEILILNNNRLTSFCSTPTGQLRDLSLLTTLDLRFNKIKLLPDEIYTLENLRELLLAKNNIVKLPKTIKSLKYLELLDISCNKVQSIDEINLMPNLRILNISENKDLKRLPVMLYTCDNLRDLILDKDVIEWPEADILNQTTDSILKYLSTGEKIDETDSNIPEKTERTAGAVEIAQDALKLNTDISKEDALIRQLDNLMKSSTKKRNSLQIITDGYGNEDALFEEIQLKQQKMKKELLQTVLLQQNENESLFNKIQQQRDIERTKLIEDIRKTEENANVVIEKFLALKNNSDVELLEKEQLEKERLLEKVQLEHSELRKQEMLCIMSEVLRDDQYKFESFLNNRCASTVDILEKEQETSKQLQTFFSNYERERGLIIEKIYEDEELQKQAVASLISKNDARSWGLIEQLKIVETQLASMTVLEIEKKQFSNVEQINELAEKRLRLTNILMDLLDQQEKRKEQLLDTLTIMEAQKCNEEQDFWLLQYQKLLDSRPLEFSVKTSYSIDPLLGFQFLVNGVIHCLPFLQKLWQNNDICLEKLNENDLENAGIRDERDRRLILLSIEKFITETNNTSYARVPSAPVQSPLDSLKPTNEYNAKPSTSTTKDSSEHEISECVICMEEYVKIIFIPCGHMCCCLNCESKVDLCPICRGNIERKIKVVQP